MNPDTFHLDQLAPLVAAVPMSSVTNSAPQAILLSDGQIDVLIDFKEELSPYRAFLQSSKRVVLFHDAKPVLRAFLRVGLDVARPICLKTLGVITKTHVDSDFPPAKTRKEAALLSQKALDRLNELWEPIEKQRQLARLENLALRAFASMEHHGLFVDKPAWQQLIHEAEQKLGFVKDEALKYLKHSGSVDLFGESTVNLDSGKEIKEALEEIIGESLTDTSHITLSKLEHPAAKAILEYREVAKLVQTYGESFLSHIDDKTGRIHARFEPIGASSGRVACREPNLQNLPSSEVFHRCIRAPEGKVLITADYAGCELRILAALSRDKVFLEAFAKDADLHSEVATQMFGMQVDKQTNAHLRQRAKAINFGLMYGMGPRALARNLEISDTEAEQLFQQYFKTYPQVKSYLDNCVEKALLNGYVETVLKRRLVFSQEKLESNEARHEISRMAKNMPIQGTGAEIVKLAMVKIHDRLSTEFGEAFLVNMIHDELVVECLEKDADLVAELVREEMEGAQTSLIPEVKPKADVHVGKFWHH